MIRCFCYSLGFIFWIGSRLGSRSPTRGLWMRVACESVHVNKKRIHVVRILSNVVLDLSETQEAIPYAKREYLTRIDITREWAAGPIKCGDYCI